MAGTVNDDVVLRLRQRDDRLSHQAAAEIERLRLEIAVLKERLTQYEAAAAMRRGTLAKTEPAQPETICNVSINAPPSAPPHGEPSDE